jgi:hypothetical protein
MTKSQLEVCGAPMMTNFGMSGSFPTTRQPNKRRDTLDRYRKTGVMMGVLKIVLFTFVPFPDDESINEF